MAVSIHDPIQTPPAGETVTVIETSQWGNVAGLTVDEALKSSQSWDPLYKRTVRPDDRCPWGRSWFRPNADGILELWRHNWDSSG